MLAACPPSRVRRCAVAVLRPARLRMRWPNFLHAWNSLSLRPPLAMWSGSYTCSNETRSRSWASGESSVAPTISKTSAHTFALAHIFVPGPAFHAISAYTQIAYTQIARNSFRMRTCEKIGRGYPSFLLSSLLTCAANVSRINTYAKPEAKSRTFCTSEKAWGGGKSSRLETTFSLLSHASKGSADARLASNSHRMCTCEIIGLETLVESTLAKKSGWVAPPPAGFLP